LEDIEMKRSGLKRVVALICLAFFAAEVFSPAVLFAKGVDDLTPAAATGKPEVGMSEVNGIAGLRKPNVLFVPDGTSFTLKGLMPMIVQKTTGDRANWPATKATYGIEFDDIVQMVTQYTFGPATLPFVGKSTITNGEMCGRDLDESNNVRPEDIQLPLDKFMEKYGDDYYFPFADEKKSAELKASFSAQSAYTLPANATFPYALVYRDPKYWQAEWWNNGVVAPAGFPTSADLFSNDSSRYKMKLALWRALSDADLTSKFRFGLAGGNVTEYITDGNLMNLLWGGIAKRAPYGNKVESMELKDASGKWRVWTTGTIDCEDTGESATRQNADSLSWVKPGRPYYSNPWDTVAPFSAFYYKAYLYAPITDASKEWGWGTVDKISHADKLKRFLDGLMDVRISNVNGYDYFANDEIFEVFGCSVNSGIGMNIFRDPDTKRLKVDFSHQQMINNALLWYSSANGPVTYSLNSVGTGPNYTWPVNRFLKGDGKATGTLMDFFSPPVFNSGFISKSAVKAAALADESIPITDPCEDNWVIMFTGGTEIEGDNGSTYDGWDGIKNLYDATATDAVLAREGRTRKAAPYEGVTIRQGSGASRVLIKGDLANPIRTMIIGFSGKPDDPTMSEYERKMTVTRIRNLHRMAYAGQGGDPDDTAVIDNMVKGIYPKDSKGNEIRPYIATNIQEMIAALDEVLTNVAKTQEQENPSEGQMSATNDDGQDSVTGDLALFASTYKARPDNQWEGYIYRHKTSDEKSGVKSSYVWELNKNVTAGRGSRKLYYWNGKNQAFNALISSPWFERMTGMDTAAMDAGSAGGSFGMVPPYDALYTWLQGWDYSYALNKTFPRSNMLADVGQGGMAYVQDPAETDFLEGYRDWARARSGAAAIAPRLYAQTNDGILHVIDPKNGGEEMAILPPPILIPHKLATLKTNAPGETGGKLQWIDVVGGEPPAGETGARRSNPVFLLDGSLQRRYMDLSQGGTASSWGTYLLGTLGRGGNGLYMLDVTNQRVPFFMWSREKIGGQFVYMDDKDAGGNADEVLLGDAHVHHGLGEAGEEGLHLAGAHRIAHHVDNGEALFP
jgi:hypothetical protein